MIERCFWSALLEQRLTAKFAATDERVRKIRTLLPSWSGHARPDDVAYRWVREFRTIVSALVN